jgi:dTDP-4-dehydrorhamnose 3,5-epimerase
MQIRPLAVEGAWEVTPRLFPDPRGVFTEGFRVDHLAEHIGHEMAVRQTNISVSTAGALRGIHYADVPPSQAKYVTATSGVFVDYIVDIRVGSPTFGQWDQVWLDTVDRRAVYLSEGLGHVLACVEEGTVVYLCSEVYAPSRERTVSPLDPEVGLTLPPRFDPVVSDRDAGAPTFAQAQAQGLLPAYEDCVAYRRSLG